VAPAQRSVRLLLWTGGHGGDRDAQSARAPPDRRRTVCNGNAANGPPGIEPGHAAVPLSAGPGCRPVRFREGRLRYVRWCGREGGAARLLPIPIKPRSPAPRRSDNRCQQQQIRATPYGNSAYGSPEQRKPRQRCMKARRPPATSGRAGVHA
jgi:hypothetical protein